MANIKEGFNQKDTQINIYVQPDRGMAEVWIKQEGLEDALPDEYQTLAETLAYADINELIIWRNELSTAIRKLAGRN